MRLQSIYTYRYLVARASLLVISLNWIDQNGTEAFVAPNTLTHPHYQSIGTSTSSSSSTVINLVVPTRSFSSSPSSASIRTPSKTRRNLVRNVVSPPHQDSKASLTITEANGSSDSSDSIDTTTSKLRRLKDRMWVREALEDITASEFACSLANSNNDDSDNSGANGVTNRLPKIKRGVDFENLLGELDRRVEEMCVLTTYESASADAWVCYPLDHTAASDINPDPTKECWALRNNVGMGSVTYTFDQRDALIARILEARQTLLIAMAGNIQIDTNNDLSEIRERLNPDGTTTTTTNNNNNNNNEQQQKLVAGEPFIYVREDGTVDWDGALQDRAALKKIGTAVWSRINGEDPETIDENSLTDESDPSSSGGSHDKEPVTAKIMETDAIREKKERLDMLGSQFKQMDEDHMALLSSAVDAGSAVANVNFATMEPSLRLKIRSSSSTLERKRYELSFQTLNYELERIYTYLDTDLGNMSAKGYIPLSDRLNVAEFGLLESQIENLNRQIAIGETVDEDVLSVVLDQTNDFKRRLGIDYSVAGFTFDWDGINTWLKDVVDQGKKGLAFYGKGCQLLSDDLAFSSSLIGRALTGYTLKPREVRTLRRTFKDVITCIPVIIILIIPLSPVGHVLVFGAIQRFFPDFFPSCFTERRQNLLSLYETAEFSGITIDENWREKIYRAMSAIGYTVADTFIRKDENVQDTTKLS